MEMTCLRLVTRHILILILLALPAFLRAQASEVQLSDIRKEYAKIGALLGSCAVVKETDWMDPEDYQGGVPIINGFYDTEAKNYIKITEKFEGDWTESTKSYYFKDGQVFFVFIRGYYGDEMYTAAELGITEEQLWESGGEAKTLIVYERRVYLSEGRVIQLLEKEVQVPENEIDFNMDRVENGIRGNDEFDGEFMQRHTAKIIKALEERRTSSK